MKFSQLTGNKSNALKKLTDLFAGILFHILCFFVSCVFEGIVVSSSVLEKPSLDPHQNRRQKRRFRADARSKTSPDRIRKFAICAVTWLETIELKTSENSEKARIPDDANLHFPSYPSFCIFSDLRHSWRHPRIPRKLGALSLRINFFRAFRPFRFSRIGYKARIPRKFLGNPSFPSFSPSF